MLDGLSVAPKLAIEFVECSDARAERAAIYDFLVTLGSTATAGTGVLVHAPDGTQVTGLAAVPGVPSLPLAGAALAENTIAATFGLRVHALNGNSGTATAPGVWTFELHAESISSGTVTGVALVGELRAFLAPSVLAPDARAEVRVFFQVSTASSIDGLRLQLPAFVPEMCEARPIRGLPAALNCTSRRAFTADVTFNIVPMAAGGKGAFAVDVINAPLAENYLWEAGGNYSAKLATLYRGEQVDTEDTMGFGPGQSLLPIYPAACDATLTLGAVLPGAEVQARLEVVLPEGAGFARLRAPAGFTAVLGSLAWPVFPGSWVEEFAIHAPGFTPEEQDPPSANIWVLEVLADPARTT
jgi:hypothetical protein